MNTYTRFIKKRTQRIQAALRSINLPLKGKKNYKKKKKKKKNCSITSNENFLITKKKIVCEKDI
jgi:plasmid maintenance system killer protein